MPSKYRSKRKVNVWQFMELANTIECKNCGNLFVPSYRANKFCDKCRGILNDRSNNRPVKPRFELISVPPTPFGDYGQGNIPALYDNKKHEYVNMNDLELQLSKWD